MATRPGGKMASVVQKSTLHELNDEVHCWSTVESAERVVAVEILGQRAFGGTIGAGARRQRVCRVISGDRR